MNLKQSVTFHYLTILDTVEQIQLTKSDIRINLEMVLSYMKSKYKEVNANTNLWIPPSHHTCLSFNNLVHIVGNGTRKFCPFILL